MDTGTENGKNGKVVSALLAVLHDFRGARRLLILSRLRRAFPIHIFGAVLLALLRTEGALRALHMRK